MAVTISASILNSDLSNLSNEIKRAASSGVDMIHFDVMDGQFVPNISFGLPVLESIKACTDLPIDVHLMIKNPYDYIEKFAAAGADIITFHVEAESDIGLTIELIHSFGLKAGVSIKPATPVDCLKPYLNKIDMVLIMTVEPGFGGQGFINNSLEKISELRKIIDENSLRTEIQVDGGINEKTAPLVVREGATNLVSGSFLFRSDNMAASVAKLRII